MLHVLQRVGACSTRRCFHISPTRWSTTRSYGILRGLSVPDSSLPLQDKIAHILGQEDAKLNEEISRLASTYPPYDDEAVLRMSSFLNLHPSLFSSSPFSLRAAALAAQAGISSTHLELRRWSSLENPPPKSEPRAFWEHGVLQVPLEQFHHDDMLATFNPNQEHKWTPYEFLFRYCKFFWSPNMSRWDLYFGTQLSQLIPVINWHGIDQTTTNATKSSQSNAQRLKNALQYFQQELDKIEQELQTVKSITPKSKLPLPWQELNSTTDAMAYVTAQYSRLASEEMHAVLSNLKRTGYYYDDVMEYMEYIQSCLDTFLFSDISLELDTKVSSKKFFDRAAIDILLRQANFLSQLPTKQPHLIKSLQKAVAIWKNSTEHEGKANIVLDSLRAELASSTLTIGPGQPQNLLTLDSNTINKISWNALDQLDEGLRSCLPATMKLFESPLMQAGLDQYILVRQFALSKYMFQRKSLADRFSEFMMQEHKDVHPLIFDMIAFEKAILNATEPDFQIEQLATPIDEFGDTNWEVINETVIVPSRAFKLVATNYDVFSIHENLTTPPQKNSKKQTPRSINASRNPNIYLIGLYADETGILSITPQWADVWNKLNEQREGNEDEVLTCGEVREMMKSSQDDEVLGYLEHLSKAGAIGLFPDA